MHQSLFLHQVHGTFITIRWARHCACSISFQTPNNPIIWAWSLVPFYRWENWNPERFCELSKSQQSQHLNQSCVRWISLCLPLSLLTLCNQWIYVLKFSEMTLSFLRAWHEVLLDTERHNPECRFSLTESDQRWRFLRLGPAYLCAERRTCNSLRAHSRQVP